MIPPESLPYLVKFIETTDVLSVQAHPDDRLAKELSVGERGKTECWYILEAEEGAGVFLGVHPGVSKEAFQQELQAGNDLSPLLKFYPAKSGDFFFVPSRTIHAIGKGLILIEVQQSCGVTFRVWDWGRLGDDGKPRELHVEQAMQTINFDPEANVSERFLVKPGAGESGKRLLAEHSDFRTFHFSVGETSVGQGVGGCQRPSSACVLRGEAEFIRGGSKVRRGQWESCLFPQGPEEVKIIGIGGEAEILWVD